MQRSLLFISLLFIFLVPSSFSQSKIKLLDAAISKLPKEVSYKGSIKDIVRWSDKSGENITILSESGVFTKGDPDADMENKNAEVYAINYLVTKDSSKVKWKVIDYERNCPFDIVCAFVNKTLQVTDLNNDGVAEVWMMYKVACRSDVSPSNMKIIMYEGSQKFAMRGQNKVQMTETELYGGDYKFDEALEKAPKKFRDFALKMWNAHIFETWGK